MPPAQSTTAESQPAPGRTAPSPSVQGKPDRGVPAQIRPGPGKPGPGKPAPFATVPLARRKPRHVWLGLSFLLIFVAPVCVSAFYLFGIARDQYASSVGFTVRREDTQSAMELLGGLGSLGGSSSSDTDILYEFIQSQQLVRAIDEALDLRAMYGDAYGDDPWFAYDPSGSIEDLTDYWRRVVRVYYDAGLIELRVTAFDPEDAFAVANAIFDRSSTMINALSDIARSDATRYARDDLDVAVARLKAARQAIQEFRARTRIVDPQADLQGQMGILNNLQQQFATALIELDLLRETTRDGDPRLVQAESRIRVIQERIAQEREKFGAGSTDPDEDYVTIIGEFERLAVDREFAQSAYVTALAAFDGATAEAQRQSRYLAAYLTPSVAERSQFPERGNLVLIIAAFAFLAWAIASLVYYAIRDRG